MKRVFTSKPGYDCKHAPCKHDPPGDHGIHGEEWFFSVIGDEGDAALTLTCFTNRYPETVDRGVRDDTPPLSGADLSLHVGFATKPPGDALPEGDCDLIGKCTIYKTSSLAGDDIVKHAIADREGDQPEAFWKALQDVFVQWSGEAQAARRDAEAWVRCQCCDGLGRVRKETGEGTS